MGGTESEIHSTQPAMWFMLAEAARRTMVQNNTVKQKQPVAVTIKAVMQQQPASIRRQACSGTWHSD